MKNFQLPLCLALLFFSCALFNPEDEKQHDERLAGTWDCLEWGDGGEYSYAFEETMYLLTMKSESGIAVRIENGEWYTQSDQIFFNGTVTECSPCSKTPPYSTVPTIPYLFAGDTLKMQWGVHSDGSWDTFTKRQ
ncbi:MAG: hypothetical protein JW863_05550 [Chitinispirillaceae bacterium]|nr:hypothetical protein [Chitinispirillaceae bacterium]